MQWIVRHEVDIGREAMERDAGALMVPGDKDAQVWRVSVRDGDTPVDLTGETVQAFFRRPDGVTVVVAGSVAGNIVTVTVPRDACLVGGLVCAYLCLGDRVTVQDAQSAAIVRANFYVDPGPGTVLTDPAETFSDITTLSGRVDDCEADIAANGAAIEALDTQVNARIDALAGSWISLGHASGVSEGASNMGMHTGAACSYRVEGGNHVIAAANVALSFTYSDSSNRVLCADAIPEEYWPGTRVVRICPVSGSDVYCRAFAGTDGKLYMEYVGRFGIGGAAAGPCASYTVNWTDIVIDWYV